MKYSLMTTTMVIDLLIGMQMGKSREEIERDYAAILKMAADAGFTAVEVTSMDLDLFGMDGVKKLLEENHLAVGGFVHMDQYACTDEAKAEKMIASAKKRIDDAAALGTDNLMLGLMAQEDVSEHCREELQTALIRNIRPIAEYGKQAGIMISVEDTPDIRLPMCDTSDTKALLDAIPELYLTYDTGNMILKQDQTIPYLETFYDRVCHIHLKDMVYVEDGQPGDIDTNGKTIAGCLHGEGIMDFDEIGRHLREHGYDGYAAVEYVGHADADNIKNALAYLQKTMEAK